MIKINKYLAFNIPHTTALVAPLDHLIKLVESDSNGLYMTKLASC